MSALMPYVGRLWLWMVSLRWDPSIQRWVRGKDRDEMLIPEYVVLTWLLLTIVGLLGFAYAALLAIFMGWR